MNMSKSLGRQQRLLNEQLTNGTDEEFEVLGLKEKIIA
jgi:hypothetical protein